jgi:signal transduction histidine kinase
VPEHIRLLYAEDNSSDADLTRAHFAAHAPDFRLDIVSTGQSCLESLSDGRYDALLLDNHLSDMDGLDVLKAALARDVAIPIVMVTAVGDEDLVVRVLKLGAWDYVPKHGDYIPTLPGVLRNAVVDYHRRQPRGRAAQRQQRRILYIERHPADIDLTRTHFAEHAPHFTLQVVRSSQEALALVDRDPFDAILTDLRMPDLTAIDLLRELRRRRLAVPVLIVTGKGTETAAAASLKLGAYDYIIKRDDYLMHLPYAIDNAIDRFSLRQANERLQAELAERERTEAERAHLADQLQQAQKIDSLGRLAGGVAHDFNNLLTVIIGYADLMLLEIAKDDPLRSNLDDIRLAADRAAGLTRQLLAFSRRQLLKPRVLDVNALIAESTRMLQRLVGEDVELVTTLDPQLARVNADPGQIDQVLVNLIVNARDAMPQGGRLIVETQNVVVGEEDAERHVTFQAGVYVMIAVSDTGPGIDPDVLPRIFEPFFTTKEPGKGTGLGLSMVYGIVKQSGGWIWVYSEPGHGTTFKIYLPRVDEPVATATQEAALDRESPRGAETVLVVEDEDTVRKLTAQALQKYGYDVIEAANGGDALLACERRNEPIPLLITDVVMPHVSGPELAIRLRQLHPEMRVLYTSGYTDDAVVRHGLLDRTMAFLQKPFSPDTLARKVRDVLDR